MKLFEPFLQPTQESNSTLSTETCISRSTFRSLSTDIQLDYARFYGLSDAGTLTADQICNSLFEETEWTPALEIEGHVRHTTAEGVIVAKDVMDIVDWLVLHHTELTSPRTRLKSPEVSDVQAQPEGMPTRFPEHRKEAVDCDNVDGNDATRNLSHNDLQRVSEDLWRSHTRLRKSVDASRKALREACADLFILRGQLEEENRYKTDVTSTITSVLGAEAMAGIQAQLDVKQKERRGTWSGVGRTKRKRRASKSDSARDPSLAPNAPYHVFTLPSTTSLASASASSEPYVEAPDLSSKRNRDDENESNFEPHKRPRLAEYIPQTILNYTSDDKSDDTFSDSEGTESLEDDAYSFLDFRGRPPRLELRSDSSSGEESQSDTDNSPKGVRWSCIPDFEDDESNDSDYQPPDWDMEDIWELEATRKSCRHPLYRFKYDKELRQCEGVMSDASLSTDNPDAGYNDAGKLSFAATTRWFGFSLSLGPLLERLPWDKVADYRPAHRHSYDLIPPPREEAIARYRLSLWNNIRDLAEDGFESESPVEFEQRLHNLLESDHLQFYFDDKEWMKFGPPPVSSRQPEPRSPKVLSLLEERWLLFLGPDSE